MPPEPIGDLLAWSGLSAAAGAAWLELSERQMRRYLAGHAVPGPVRRALELKRGLMGALHPDWSGWWLRWDGLLLPQGLGDRHGVRPGDIYAAWWDRQRLAALTGGAQGPAGCRGAADRTSGAGGSPGSAPLGRRSADAPG